MNVFCRIGEICASRWCERDPLDGCKPSAPLHPCVPALRELEGVLGSLLAARIVLSEAHGARRIVLNLEQVEVERVLGEVDNSCEIYSFRSRCCSMTVFHSPCARMSRCDRTLVVILGHFLHGEMALPGDHM